MMLVNTLKMLVMAGQDALRTTCGLPVKDEAITQIRHGHLVFPSLGEVRISGGTLQRIHLGCDAMLAGHLAENVAVDDEGSGLEVMAKRFLDGVLEEMDGRRPRGWLENLEVGPMNLHSRGLRSFGLCLRTDVGQLYLMADVPSRAELEAAKQSEFLGNMARTYLPKDWMGAQSISLSSDVDNFLIFLRKTETDIQVEVPEQDGHYTMHTGVLLETVSLEGRRVMSLSLDLAEPDGRSLQPGEKVMAKVGIKDRAITFETEYVSSGELSIAGAASIKCVYFNLPQSLGVEQRRRAFRIHNFDHISVEIECVDPETGESPGFSGLQGGQSVRGRLADLSFSGTRITAPVGRFDGCAKKNDHLVCRIQFPDQDEPLRVMGVVRWVSVSLVDRDTEQDEMGLEFLVSGKEGRPAMEYIRQYVLMRQRAWLAQRVHVSHVEQW